MKLLVVSWTRGLIAFGQMQQQELEEVRQREANLTALAAIGPRKKRRLDDTSTVSASLL